LRQIGGRGIGLVFAIGSTAGELTGVTPQELERLGIAITGSGDWIKPLARLMEVHESRVRLWWAGTVRIAATKQRRILLLAGQPDWPLVPGSARTRFQLDRIMALHDGGHNWTAIGLRLGMSRQTVYDLVSRYQREKPMPECSKLQCPVCSARFWPRKRKQTCCSWACTYQHRRLLSRPPKKSCAECGTVFQPRDWKGKYCSPRCRNRHITRRTYRRRKMARAAA
jgi:hypothetical protein